MAMRLALGLLRRLAGWPLPVLRALGGVLGVALWALAAGRRHVVARNLALAFPERSRWARARLGVAVFVHFVQALLDRGWLWHGPPALLQQRVRLVGDLAPLQSAEPVVLFAPHFVGLDVGWARLTQAIDRDWWTVYAPQVDGLWDDWVKAGRQRWGRAHVVSRHEGPRPVVKGLREGGALYLLPDLDFLSRQTVFAPFFGVPASTVTSLSRLADLGGARVLSVVTVMVPGGYEMHIGPLWPDYPTDNAEADTHLMNQRLEDLVRQWPAQYHWVHRRYKRRPPGEPPVYRR